MDELIAAYGCNESWEGLHNAASAFLRRVRLCGDTRARVQLTGTACRVSPRKPWRCCARPASKLRMWPWFTTTLVQRTHLCSMGQRRKE